MGLGLLDIALLKECEKSFACWSYKHSTPPERRIELFVVELTDCWKPEHISQCGLAAEVCGQEFRQM